MTGYKKFFDPKRTKIKMSLSVQRSVVESFKFNGKHARSVYFKDVRKCLVLKDVYERLGTTKKMGSKQYSGLFLRNIRSGLVMIRLIWRRVWTINSIPNQTPCY